jgi:hypothetical protein
MERALAALALNNTSDGLKPGNWYTERASEEIAHNARNPRQLLTPICNVPTLELLRKAEAVAEYRTVAHDLALPLSRFLRHQASPCAVSRSH